MRQSFIEGAEWADYSAELARMEKLTKADVVTVANRYFGDDFVAVHQIDAQHTLPSVAKPPDRSGHHRSLATICFRCRNPCHGIRTNRAELC